MNMEGVEASPQAKGWAFSRRIPWSTCSSSWRAEMRESCPTPIFSSSGDFLDFSASHRTKARAISWAVSGVRVTGWPSTPATATPRTSLPFCSFSMASLEIAIA